MRSALSALLLATGCLAGPLVARDSYTATVDLSKDLGAPTHRASGFIYGIPDVPNQIPDHWYTDIDFQYGRAGGAQLQAPDRGWIYGLTEYYGRFFSSLSNYRTCRKYGAKFILLPHDVWGTDHANSSTVWPGDNGNWTDYDNFIHQLMSDILKYDMYPGLVWDVWNEPDIGIFWQRSQEQWIELFIRTWKLLRADPRFNEVQISGPSLAFRPEFNNTWWTNWLGQIAGNHTIPDQYSYHLEGTTYQLDNDPAYTNKSLAALLDAYDLPQPRFVNINEYATYTEQIPSGYAWWISRLERYQFQGLLGNWQNGLTLHDLFADLLTKYDDPFNYTARDYAPAPGYWVYKYYAHNMTGHVVATAGSGDGWFDVYATAGDKVRLLAGSKTIPGNYSIQVNRLSSAGLPSAGNLRVDTWGFLGDDPFNPLAVTGPPTLRSSVTQRYSGDSINIPVAQDTHTGWGIELSAAK